MAILVRAVPDREFEERFITMACPTG